MIEETAAWKAPQLRIGPFPTKRDARKYKERMKTGSLAITRVPIFVKQLEGVWDGDTVVISGCT